MDRTNITITVKELTVELSEIQMGCVPRIAAFSLFPRHFGMLTA